MTETSVNQQTAEIDYINSLLGVSRQPLPELKIDKQMLQHTNAVSPVEQLAQGNMYQLIQAAGLKLGIQFSEITQAVDQENAIVENGMLFHNEKKLAIVDIAAMIRPDNKSTENKQYLLIESRLIAIACQQILNMEKIVKEIVCWRNKDSQRRWLAGTVKQKGVALLDLAELQRMYK